MVKLLRMLACGSRYGLNLLAVCANNKFEINPEPNLRLWKGSIDGFDWSQQKYQ